MKYTIKEDFRLPSNGLIDKKAPVEIELRSMTTREDMIRQSPSLYKYKKYATMIDNCILNKPEDFTSYDLYVGDFDYLLTKLRIVTFGPDYDCELHCPHCDKPFNYKYSLDDLNCVCLDEELKKTFDNLTDFTLPVSKERVKINYPTYRLLDNIDRLATTYKEDKTKNDLDVKELAKLVSILNAKYDDLGTEKKMSSFDKEEYLLRLNPKDSQKILKNFDKLMTLAGLDTVMTVTCDKCDKQSIAFFRFDQQFFGPEDNE